MPGWGRGNSTRLPRGGPGPVSRERQGAAALRIYRCRTGDSVLSVASLRTSANPSSDPAVVLMEMPRQYLARLPRLEISSIDGARETCRKVRDHSRGAGLAVAFIRMINDRFLNRAAGSVRRIRGFEPSCNEMIFERSSPSCYSDEPFAALADPGRGDIGPAGFAGDEAFLSLPVDAFHRNHEVTYPCDSSLYLCDTSASHAVDEMPAGDVPRAISKISGIYAEVFETDDWIEQTLSRKLGYGKNAGG
jgi:hypothetical protein